MHVRCPFRSAALLLALVASSVGDLRGQAPAAFAELSVPSGARASSLQQIGKIAVYDDGTRLQAWSAHTRIWRGVARSASASVRMANDWLVLRDGAKWDAFSSMRGVWTRLQTSSAAAIVNPASQRNDSILVVRDGDTLHAFSGFTGRWVSQSIPSSAQVRVQRHAAVATDGSLAWGLGAFDMVWRSKGLPGSATVSRADSFGATVESAGQVFGYSAQTRSWSSARLPGGAFTRHGTGDVQLWVGAPLALAYSALQGRFVATSVGGGIVRVGVEDELAYVQTGSGTALFSAPRATWLRTAIPSSASVRTSATVAIFVEATQVHAYSALRASVTTRNESVRALTLARAVAGCQQQNGRPLLFSASSGRWSSPPARALSKAPNMLAHAALLESSGGHLAWSARSDRYVERLHASGAVLFVNPATSIPAIVESGAMHVFDERAARWLSRTRTSTQAPSIWRTSMLAVDGSSLVGFASQTGRLEEIRVGSNGAFALRAGSELVTALHGKGVWAYSATPDLLTAAQFPEFRRIFTIGSTLPIYLAAPAGSAVLPMLGVRRSGQATPFGTLDLELATVVLGPALSVSADASASFEVSIPVDAALRGVELAWQGLVLPKSSGAYLTRSAQSSLQ